MNECFKAECIEAECINHRRPKVHLFGHAHHIAQVVVEDGIMFSNGTQGERCLGHSKPAVIDVHYPQDSSQCIVK